MRREELTEEDAQRIEQLFRRHCEQELYHIVPDLDVDYHQAREWMAQPLTAVRTLDALHLATTDRRGGGIRLQTDNRHPTREHRRPPTAALDPDGCRIGVKQTA